MSEVEKTFECTVPGKWILSGEHAVIRGFPAIAMPLRELCLRFHYELLEDAPEGHFVAPKPLLDILSQLGIDTTRLRGEVRITSNIPQGAGLGSSAALCVSTVKWLVFMGLIENGAALASAIRAEDLFHGKSSGLDVTTVWNDAPILYSRSEGGNQLATPRLPNVSFHDSGLRSSTKDCVAHVSKLHETHPAFAEELDGKMAAASILAEEGLLRYQAEPSYGLSLLTQAITKAQECFESWGLVPSSVGRIKQDLLKKGALAVKTVGAGNGGYLVALWPDSSVGMKGLPKGGEL